MVETRLDMHRKPEVPEGPPRNHFSATWSRTSFLRGRCACLCSPSSVGNSGKMDNHINTIRLASFAGGSDADQLYHLSGLTARRGERRRGRLDLGFVSWSLQNLSMQRTRADCFSFSLRPGSPSAKSSSSVPSNTPRSTRLPSVSRSACAAWQSPRATTMCLPSPRSPS